MSIRSASPRPPTPGATRPHAPPEPRLASSNFRQP
jgi:hypothetical protein